MTISYITTLVPECDMLVGRPAVTSRVVGMPSEPCQPGLDVLYSTVQYSTRAEATSVCERSTPGNLAQSMAILWTDREVAWPCAKPVKVAFGAIYAPVSDVPINPGRFYGPCLLALLGEDGGVPSAEWNFGE